MPLLSRVFRCPAVQGVHYYQPPPGQTTKNAVDTDRSRQDCSGSSENLPNEDLSPAEGKLEKEDAPLVQTSSGSGRLSACCWRFTTK